MEWFRVDVRARVFLWVVFIGICSVSIMYAVLFWAFYAFFGIQVPASTVVLHMLTFVGPLLVLVIWMSLHSANHAHEKVKKVTPELYSIFEYVNGFPYHTTLDGMLGNLEKILRRTSVGYRYLGYNLDRRFYSSARQFYDLLKCYREHISEFRKALLETNGFPDVDESGIGNDLDAFLQGMSLEEATRSYGRNEKSEFIYRSCRALEKQAPQRVKSLRQEIQTIQQLQKTLKQLFEDFCLRNSIDVEFNQNL